MVLQNTPAHSTQEHRPRAFGLRLSMFRDHRCKRSTGVERERIDPIGVRKTCMWHISMCAKQAAKPARRLVARYYHADENTKQANGLIKNTFWINPHVLRSCTQERQAVQWHV